MGIAHVSATFIHLPDHMCAICDHDIYRVIIIIFDAALNAVSSRCFKGHNSNSKVSLKSQNHGLLRRRLGRPIAAERAGARRRGFGKAEVIMYK